MTIDWIPVQTRLPDDDATVLVHAPTASEPVWLGWRSPTGWYTVDHVPFDPDEVTHWAPMPAGPRS